MKKQTKLGLVLAAAAVISVSVASLVSARGWVQNGADWYYVDNNNEYVTDTIQSSGNSKFYLGEDGRMERDYFLEDFNGQTYYFGQNGAMVTNTWVAIESSRVENQDDYVPDNYWYYFQSSGKAMKAGSSSIKKTTIDGKKYAFNEYGQMCVGWVNSEGKTINPDDDTNPFVNALYYAGGDNDGVLRAGWLTYYDGYDSDSDDYQTEYNQLYFYFNTSNNKKYGMNGDNQGEATTKKINGRTYAFNSEGIMVSGWDVYDNLASEGVLSDKVTYFSKDDDGHQVKKGWVYAVPAERIDQKAYDDDEEKYMYFASSGDIVKDQFKKINGKFYAFSRTGIMKTGLVLWCADGETVTTNSYHYVDTVDLDWANGSDIAKKGRYQYDSYKYEYYEVNNEGMVVAVGVDSDGNNKNTVRPGRDYIKMHYFGNDGARKTGSNSVEFSDDTYTIQTNASGDKGSGIFSKKYYSLGVLLKASQDIRYGIYNLATVSDLTAKPVNLRGEPLSPQSEKLANGTDDLQYYYGNIEKGNYVVLTTGGSKQKGNKSAKKDADGNYWVLDPNSGALKGIWTQNVKQSNSISNFVTKRVRWAAYKDAVGDAEAEARYQRASGATNGNYKYITNCSIASLSEVGLYIDGTNEVLELTSGAYRVRWTAYFSGDGNNREVYFSAQNTYTGSTFQTDYYDKSNKWVPLGLLDNANKTITFKLSQYSNPQSADYDARTAAYCVKPTDDYFLNCYWLKDNNSK